MTAYLELARECAVLRGKGLTNPEIRKRLALPDSAFVERAVTVFERLWQTGQHQLTVDECRLILRVGRAQHAALERGDICSPKLKHINRWGLRHAPATVARRRLGTHRKGEDERQPGTGLALLHAYHGGYVRLLPAGWAAFHLLNLTAFGAADAEEAR